MKVASDTVSGWGSVTYKLGPEKEDGGTHTNDREKVLSKEVELYVRSGPDVRTFWQRVTV